MSVCWHERALLYIIADGKVKGIEKKGRESGTNYKCGV